MSLLEIAQQIGCTIGTLKVNCSRHGISLRQPKPPKPPKPQVLRFRSRSIRLSVPLSHPDVAQLSRRANSAGVSRETLAARLLRTIVKDDLFQAVLDEEVA